MQQFWRILRHTSPFAVNAANLKSLKRKAHSQTVTFTFYLPDLILLVLTVPMSDFFFNQTGVCTYKIARYKDKRSGKIEFRSLCK